MPPSDSQSPPSSGNYVGELVDAAAMHEAWNNAAEALYVAAEKDATKIRLRAVERVDKVVDKYTHAVEITHKDELEKLYTNFRNDFDAEEAKIAAARGTVTKLSAEMQDVLSALAETIAEVVGDEAKRHAGFSETIKAHVKDEEEALGPIGGPMYTPEKKMT